MAELNVKIEGEQEVLTLLSKLPDTLYKNSETVFKKSSFALQKKVQQNATKKLKVRTGLLRRSIGRSTFGASLSTLGFSVFSEARVGGNAVVYAPIHEYGGTVKAKNAYKKVPGGPYLNIPAPGNKTPAGVQRLGAREVFNQGGYIRGKVVYLNGEPMFWLVKSVKIKARLGMEKAAADEIPTLLAGLKEISMEG